MKGFSMTLEELLNQYEIDANVDENKLDYASIQTIHLHCKYLKYLMDYKTKRIRFESEYEELRNLRFKYYRGELSRETLEERAWTQYQGPKMLKSEVDDFLRGDSILLKAKAKLEYLNEMVFACEQIMNSIKSRDWSIRNAIEAKKWYAGAN
jgi:hypothetical protein